MKHSQSFVRFITAACSGLLLTAGTLHAGVGDEFTKLIASDGEPFDFFSDAIAISGTTAIISSVGDDDNGSLSGSAYLFDTVTGLQLAKLLPNDGAAGDLFGHSVGISGTTAIIGAPNDTGAGSLSGSAYLFDTVSGLQTAKLFAFGFAENDQFGKAVSISGTTAIVGALGDDDNGSNAGAAYLFDTVTGTMQSKLLATDGGANELFGNSVSISGTTAIVGARRKSDNGISSGAAYLFDTVTGLQTAKLLPTDSAAFDEFGSTVSISGTTAIVGSPGDDDDGSGWGSAYLFDTVTGMQIAKLLPADGYKGFAFGISVAISGGTAVVGDQQSDDNGNFSGSVYLFDAVTGMQIDRLVALDGAENDFFGNPVAMSGTTAISGSSSDGGNGVLSGSAYLIDTSFPSAFTSDVSSISLGTGGAQVLSLEAGASCAGTFYLTLGSVTGTAPGIDFGGGVILPLNFDAYMSLTLFKPGLSAFGNFSGILDGAGQGVATFTLPPLTEPSLVGVTINHAYLAATVFGMPSYTSNAVPVLLVP